MLKLRELSVVSHGDCYLPTFYELAVFDKQDNKASYWIEARRKCSITWRKLSSLGKTLQRCSCLFGSDRSGWGEILGLRGHPASRESYS